MSNETLFGFMMVYWRQYDRLKKSGKAHIQRDALSAKTKALIYSDRLAATCS